MIDSRGISRTWLLPGCSSDVWLTSLLGLSLAESHGCALSCITACDVRQPVDLDLVHLVRGRIDGAASVADQLTHRLQGQAKHS
jgi:hypothetical protein